MIIIPIGKKKFKIREGDATMAVLGVFGFGLLGWWYLNRQAGGTPPPPPPPPPLTCPTNYVLSADGSRCIPLLPPRSPTVILSTPSIRITDRSNTDMSLNILQYVPNGFTGSFKINVRALDISAGVDAAYVSLNRSYTNFGGGYTNNYLRIQSLKACTTYRLYAYLTAQDDSATYSPLNELLAGTRGCV